MKFPEKFSQKSNELTEEQLNDWADHLDFNLTSEVCETFPFDYENEETFDEEGNCDWEVYYAKSKEKWNTFSYEKKLAKYKQFNK